jgi:uncharacterized protein YjbI with pentapeptide repeats
MLDILMFATEPFGTWGPGTGGEPSFWTWSYWQQGGGGASRSEIVRNLGLLAVALIALGFGIWRAITAYLQTQASQKQADAAIEQARIAEQGHITDRYAKAVEMLTSNNMHSRTGAVYALARIAQDSVERDHVPIMAVLSEFVCNPPYAGVSRRRAKARQQAQEIGEQDANGPDAPEIPPPIQCPDIVAALRSIAQRNVAQNAQEKSVGFHVRFVRANLQELDLERAQLTGAFLMMANLTGARLTSANLTGADLTGADLKGADLKGADLTGADLTGADLAGADLTGADLTGADLRGADLRGANLTFARLTDSNFSFANLTDASLIHVEECDGAKFLGARLAGADLSYSNLAGADLAGADLTGANLTWANFNGAQNIPDLSLAYADPDNPPINLPEDVKRPEPWEPRPEE